MANGEVTTNDIMEFLREHMVTREEFLIANQRTDALSGTVDSLSGKVDALSGTVDSLSGRVDLLSETVGSLSDKIDRLTVRVISNEERMDTFATKDDLMAVKSDLIAHIDGFAKQNQTLDQEMTFTTHRQDRFEERLGVVEHKLGLAT